MKTYRVDLPVSLSRDYSGEDGQHGGRDLSSTEDDYD